MIMKKYIFLLIALVAFILPSNVNAQIAGGSPSKTWTFPVVTALDEEVTWYFDLTGSAFTDGQDLYLWDWSPSEPDAGNWAKSSDFAKLTYVGNMVWKKTLTPTLYFNRSVADILGSAGFWMRLKDLTGTIQSDVIQMPITATTLTSFATSGKAVQIFPAKFYLDQPLSLLVNVNEVYAGGVKGGLGTDPIYLHSGLNNYDPKALVEAQLWDPTRTQKVKLKSMGNGIYKMDMIPMDYYGVTNDYVMENIAFELPTMDWAKLGTDANGGSYVISAPGVVVVNPQLYIFPKKFSQNDLITIVRLNNEKNVSKLTYTLTAGTKTLTGDFFGSKADMRAYINLTTQLAGLPSLDKIHLVVTDNNNVKILDTDITLVQLSELE